MSVPPGQRVAVGLSVGDAAGATVSKDGPLVFDVSVSSPALSSAASRNREIDQEVAKLDADLKAGKIKASDYRTKVSSLMTKKESVSPIILKGGGGSWTSALRFQQLANGWADLGWRPQVLSTSSEGDVAELGPTTTLSAELGISPSDLGELPFADHTIRAVLQTGEEAVPSNGVNLKVTAQKKATEDELVRNARFYLRTNDLSRALEAAESILKEAPHSIQGLLLKADWAEAAGHLHIALELIEDAEKQWHAQGLDAEEGPRYIKARELELRTKLGGLGS